MGFPERERCFFGRQHVLHATTFSAVGNGLIHGGPQKPSAGDKQDQIPRERTACQDKHASISAPGRGLGTSLSGRKRLEWFQAIGSFIVNPNNSVQRALSIDHED